MPISINNNAVVVRGGIAAQDCGCCKANVRARITSPLATQDDEIAIRSITNALATFQESEQAARQRVSDILNFTNPSLYAGSAFPEFRITGYALRSPFPANQWKSLQLFSATCCNTCEYVLSETVNGAPVVWRVFVSTTNCTVSVTAFQIPASTMRRMARPDILPGDNRIQSSFDSIITNRWTAVFQDPAGSCFFPPFSSLIVEPATDGTQTNVEIRYSLAGSQVGATAFSLTQPYVAGVPVTFSLPCEVNNSPLGATNPYMRQAPLAETTYSQFSTAANCPQTVFLSTMYTAEVEVTIN